MHDGIYHVSFSSQQGVIGSGVVTVKGNVLNGGDDGYVYQGHITDGPSMTAALAVKRHDRTRNSIFGSLDAFDLDLTGVPGTAQGLSVSGAVRGSPGRRITIHPRRVGRRNRGQSWLLQPEAERAPHSDHGRYHFFRDGSLDITASLEAMDWILRFHAAIFGALTARGFKFAPQEPSKDRHGRALPAAIVAMGNGESFAIEFKEGYKRVQLDEAEMAKRKKETGYAPCDGRDMVGSGNFKFIVTGTERRASSEWARTRDRLEKKLGEIVQRIDELVVLQPKLRQQAKAEEQAARRSAARQERARQIRASRAEQLKRAFAMAAAHEEHKRLAAYLKLVETEASDLSPQQAAKLQNWIAWCAKR